MVCSSAHTKRIATRDRPAYGALSASLADASRMPIEVRLAARMSASTRSPTSLWTSAALACSRVWSGSIGHSTAKAHTTLSPAATMTTVSRPTGQRPESAPAPAPTTRPVARLIQNLVAPDIDALSLTAAPDHYGLGLAERTGGWAIVGSARLGQNPQRCQMVFRSAGMASPAGEIRSPH